MEKLPPTKKETGEGHENSPVEKLIEHFKEYYSDGVVTQSGSVIDPREFENKAVGIYRYNYRQTSEGAEDRLNGVVYTDGERFAKLKVEKYFTSSRDWGSEEELKKEIQEINAFDGKSVVYTTRDGEKHRLNLPEKIPAPPKSEVFDLPKLEKTDVRKYFTPQEEKIASENINDYFNKINFYTKITKERKNTPLSYKPRWCSTNDPSFGEIVRQNYTYESVDQYGELDEYITNPETALLDYGLIGEPEILEYNPEDIYKVPKKDRYFRAWKENLESVSGRRMASVSPARNLGIVANYIRQHYEDRYYIPGVEYQKYLYENPDKIPEILKDGKECLLFGSAFRYPGGPNKGDWMIPSSVWRGAEQRLVSEGEETSHDYDSKYFRILVFKKPQNKDNKK